MALSGVIRPGFVQIRVLDMPAALEHYTKRIGLHQVTEGPDGRVYLKSADEFDHHSVILRRADSAGIDLMAFKVLEDADLEKFEKRIVDYGIAVDHVKAGASEFQFELPADFNVISHDTLWWSAVAISLAALTWAIWQSKRETGTSTP